MRCSGCMGCRAAGLSPVLRNSGLGFKGLLLSYTLRLPAVAPVFSRRKTKSARKVGFLAWKTKKFAKYHLISGNRSTFAELYDMLSKAHLGRR